MQPREDSAFRRRLRVWVFIASASLVILGQTAMARDEKSIAGFTEALIKMAPDVDPAEAQAVAQTSHVTARRLAVEYRVVGPCIFQNFLIHIGVRQRGYCFHWARDIGAQLRKLPLRTLDLHWGAASPGTRLEHNCIVVTARGRPFNSGYLIDGWRAAGRLLWWPVTKDIGYVWQEDRAETAWLQNNATPNGHQPKRVESTGRHTHHAPGG